MKINITKSSEYDAKYLYIKCYPCEWDKTIINGEQDDSLMPNIPGFKFGNKHNKNYWEAIIDIDNGQILNWPNNIKANILYYVKDDGYYALLDKNKKEIVSYIGYAPDKAVYMTENNSRGYGGQISLNVDNNGKINYWDPNFERFKNLKFA